MNRVGAAEEGKLAKLAKADGKKSHPLIEISISCRNLADKDQLSKSDPICVIYNTDLSANKFPREWTEIQKTELMENNLNPDFATKLQIEYRFEQCQLLRFQVYDVDSATAPIVSDDTIGFVECTVAKIVSAGPKGHTEDLTPLGTEAEGAGSVGQILLIAEESATSSEEIFLQLGGSVGYAPPFCCLPSVRSYFVISKLNDAGNFLLAHRSPEVRGRNPDWSSLTLPSQSLCYGDKERSLKIEVWRKTLQNEDQLAGFTCTTINKMVGMTDKQLFLKSSSGKSTGSSVSVLSCTVSPIFSFMDFIQAGTLLHLCFSIDFTLSNGADYKHPSSLHHISTDNSTSNPYEEALEAMGRILTDYDDDNVFPVFGFGAKVPPLGTPSHDFPVTLGTSPDCHGIQGVLDAYRSCVQKIQLFGPTHIAPVIQIVNGWAEKVKPGQDYYILIILMDGSVDDMAQTKQTIIKSSTLPVSIVIVGIGSADFKSMNDLDGDDGLVHYADQRAERDVVQFVEYRSAKSWLKRAENDSSIGDNNAHLAAQGLLAEAVLKEIPDQILSYMKANGIEPSAVIKHK